ncbi:MADS-box transcription factor 14 isoform X1 [Cryptomeria japonica]|uniref:MADS-box transcription factor 14 isoform X1 n=1 Tax=Cryptomeria japonica TaxID=3369 RepID=UPI0025AB84F5|nr:MADS-box transcription factor 14 isoform X1 [Cryptomeria japonica]
MQSNGRHSKAESIIDDDKCKEREKSMGNIEDSEVHISDLKCEDLEGLSVKQLKVLEEKLEKGLRHVRAKKNQEMIEQMNESREKGNKLMEENANLYHKLKELQTRSQGPKLQENIDDSEDLNTSLHLKL